MLIITYEKILKFIYYFGYEATGLYITNKSNSVAFCNMKLASFSYLLQTHLKKWTTQLNLARHYVRHLKHSPGRNPANLPTVCFLLVKISLVAMAYNLDSGVLILRNSSASENGPSKLRTSCWEATIRDLITSLYYLNKKERNMTVR